MSNVVPKTFDKLHSIDQKVFINHKSLLGARWLRFVVRLAELSTRALWSWQAQYEQCSMFIEHKVDLSTDLSQDYQRKIMLIAGFDMLIFYHDIILHSTFPWNVAFTPSGDLKSCSSFCTFEHTTTLKLVYFKCHLVIHEACSSLKSTTPHVSIELVWVKAPIV